MFDTQENRYITRGVNEKVPKEIQQRCFLLIDEKAKEVEFSWSIYKSLSSIETTEKVFL